MGHRSNSSPVSAVDISCFSFLVPSYGDLQGAWLLPIRPQDQGLRFTVTLRSFSPMCTIPTVRCDLMGTQPEQVVQPAAMRLCPEEGHLCVSLQQ
jgi:hypothetical protein